MKKQVSIRLEEEAYKQLRIELLKEDLTVQQYLYNLIVKDGKVKLDEKKDI